MHPELQEYSRDVSDHLDRVREQVQSFDELLVSIVQSALARLSISKRGHAEDLRLVAIAAVPTLIAAIYGMNFQYMPELDQPWGYPAAASGMAMICAALYRGFKRNGWL